MFLMKSLLAELRGKAKANTEYVNVCFELLKNNGRGAGGGLLYITPLSILNIQCIHISEKERDGRSFTQC